MSRQLRCIINDNGPRRRSRASYARRKSHEYKKILYQRATDSVRFDVSPLPVSRNEAIDEPPILRFHLFHFVTFTIEGWPQWRDERRREARKKRVRAIHAVTASGGGTIVVVRTDHPSERKVAPPKANLIVNLGVHRKLRNSLAA